MAKKKSDKKKSFHFSLGDSSTGPIGFCARIVAANKDEAVARLRDLLETNTDDVGGVMVLDSGPEYIQAYINPEAITASDIDDTEEA